MQLHFFARRLLLSDLAEEKRLFDATGRDGAWAAGDALREAEPWGGFLGDAMVLGSGLCSLQSAVNLAQMVRGAQITTQNAQLLLPCAAAPAGIAHTKAFLDMLTARALQREGAAPLLALLPVKTGGPLLQAYFAAQFVLCAIRPLYELRPHYVFFACSVQTVPQNSIIIPYHDTLRLSRALAEGWCGTALRGDSIILQRMKQK